MDLNKTLIAYGKLKIKERDLNEKISKVIQIYYDDGSAEYKQEIQLFRYFAFNKHDLDQGDQPFSLEDWAEEKNEEIDPETYDLLNLIELRKVVRAKLGYRKMVITKYAIKLSLDPEKE